MQEANTTALDFPSTESKDVLTEILREGAQTLLVQAIEGEVADWIECHANIKAGGGSGEVHVEVSPAVLAQDEEY